MYFFKLMVIVFLFVGSEGFIMIKHKFQIHVFIIIFIYVEFKNE